MSIEMENPKTAKELVDAAWNYVEQIRLAFSINDRVRVEHAVNEASRLLSLVMEKLEESE